MPRALPMLPCAALLALALVPAPSQAAEVLSNGGFQAGLAGWTSYTTANGTISETPSTPNEAQAQVAAVASFNVNGSGPSSALFLNVGKINGPYGSAPGEGGGVLQAFTTAGGTATFSADIAALYTRGGGFGGIGLLSVLLDGVERASFDFGGGTAGPVTRRSTLDFTTSLSAGQHVLSLQATRLFAPGRGVTSQYFDNVSLDVAATPGAVPEPATWGLTLAGFGLIGAGLRSRRRTVSFSGT